MPAAKPPEFRRRAVKWFVEAGREYPDRVLAIEGCNASASTSRTGSCMTVRWSAMFR